MSWRLHRDCFNKYKLGVSELRSAVSAGSYCNIHTHTLAHANMATTLSLGWRCITNASVIIVVHY